MSGNRRRRNSGGGSTHVSTALSIFTIMTMPGLKERLLHAATPQAIMVAVLLYAVSVVALTLSDAQIALYAPTVTKPDLHFGFDHAEVVAILTALGTEGRRLYAVNLAIDTVMPLMLAAAALLVVARAFPRRLWLLSVAPAAFFLLDVAENAAFAMMLVQYPDVAPGLVAATSPVTMIKLVSFAVTFPTLIVGLLTLGVRWIRKWRTGRPV